MRQYNNKSVDLRITKYRKQIVVFLFLLSFFSCKDFVQVDPPNTSLVNEIVFREDATALAAMTSAYSAFTVSGFSSGTPSGVTFLGGLSSDEFRFFGSVAEQSAFSTNSLLASSLTVGTLWSSAYGIVYRANSVLEGVAASTTLSKDLAIRLEGEAKFLRAFSFFYLVNLFGDVPITTTTDYRINGVMAKSSQSKVYEQIVTDLKEAQRLLPDNYAAYGNERVRINKWVATAMLARVYLYMKNWIEAELESTKLIENLNMFKLLPLKDVFLKNSQEAIWQLNNNERNSNEATVFMFSTKPTLVSVEDTIYKSFSVNDQRKANWILAKTSSGITYYQLNKYKAATVPPITNPITQPVEYSTVLRLAEQFLIRAEARTQQGKLTGANSAENDINTIRVRAGLSEIILDTKEEIMQEIETQRKLEFVGEWAHRWLDLKRTNRANEVLGPIKGTNWQQTDQLYPLPQEQLQNNPAMSNAQNPGYN